MTDIRLVFPQYMKADTPFWNALRRAGYNKLIRPNLPESGVWVDVYVQCALSV